MAFALLTGSLKSVKYPISPFLKKGLYKSIGFTMIMLLCFTSGYGQFSAPTNLVVLQVQGSSNAATAIKLIEYSPSGGSAVSTVTIPSSTKGNRVLMSGSATSEGFISLSAEQDRVIVTGYDTTLGIASVASSTSTTAPRVVASVNSAGTFTYNFGKNVYTGNNIRGGVASGSNFFASGAATGIILMNSATTLSATSTNNRQIEIINGNIYFTSGTGSSRGLYQMGTGISTSTGQTATNIASTGGAGNAEGFTISPDGNTLYLADGTTASAITKWTRTGGTGSFSLASYTVYTGTGCSGVVADFSTTNPTIYATTADGLNIIKFTDAGSTVTTAAASLAIVTTTASLPFRGITFAPSCSATISTLGASSICSGTSKSVIIKGNPTGIVSYNINGGSTSTTTIGANGIDTLSLGSLTVNTTVNLISISTTACSSVSLSGSVTITVGPAPITGTASVCSGASINLSDTTGSGAGTWSSNATTVATIGTSGIVTGTGAGTTTISYTFSGCSATQIVTVNPLPSAISGTATVTAGSTTALSDPDAGGTWNSVNTGVATIGATTGTVTGVSSGTATISYTFGTGCATTIAVTVNSATASAITGSMNVCSGTTTALTDTTAGGTWSSDNTTVATIDAFGVVTGVSAGTSTITYAFLAGGTTTATVVVNASPASISGTAVVCTGALTTLSNSSPGGTWSSSNTSVASIGTAGDVTGISNGTAVITYTAGGCTATLVVTVNPLPSAISGNMPLCAGGSTISLSDATSGGTWSSSNTTVAIVGSAGDVTSGSAGTATITYTSAIGCSVTVTATVNAVPSSITGTASLCAGSTTALSNSVSGGTWSSSATGTATVNGTGVVTGVSGGTVTISYTTGGICSVITTVTVNAAPAAITGTLGVCVSGTTNLTDATTGGNWSNSATAIATIDNTGLVTGVSGGTATVTYTLSATGCSITANVTVSTLPTGGTITGTDTVIVGGTTSLIDITAGGAWSSTNTSVASIGSTGIVTGVAAGTTTISYTVTTGCGSASASVTVLVISSSLTQGNLVVLRVGDGSGALSGNATINNVVEYTTSGTPTGVMISLPTSGTTKLTTSGSATSEGQMAMSAERDRLVISGYDVAAGTGSVASSVSTTGINLREVFTMDATGAYTKVSAPPSVFSGNNIRAATASGTNYFGSGAGGGSGFNGIQLMTTSNSNVQVSSTKTNTRCINIFNGQLYFTISGANGLYQVGSNIPTTSGQTSSVITTGSGGSSPYNFSFSPDGNTLYIADDASGIQKYTKSGGSYAFGYTVCDTTGRGLVVDYSGSNPVLYFTSGSAATASIIYKVTDAGSTHATPSVLATAPTNTAFRGIAFAPACKATITALSSSICTGTSGSVIISGNPTGVVSYNINGGSGTTTTIGANGQDTLNLGTLTSNTTVNLVSISTAACSSVSLSGNATIVVSPAQITGTASVCAGLAINLSDTTGSGAGTWSCTTTTIATVGSTGTVSGVSAGTATISYTYSGCSATQTVTVNPSPNAITGTTTLNAGGTNALSDAIAGGTWSIANTAIATVDVSGNVTGVVAGTTTVTYALPAGCAATATITINAAPSSAISGTMTLCTGMTTALTDTSSGGTWNSGNTSVATIDAFGMVTGISAGTSAITYSYSGGGSTTATVTVNASPSAISGTASVCAGATVTLSNSTTGGTWSSSVAGTATVNSSGVVTGVSGGTTTITYTSTGCIATLTVTVNAVPAITGMAAVCAGSATTFTDATAGGTWSSSNTSVASVGTAGDVTGALAGTATITYTIPAGCSATITVTVDAVPSAISGTTTLCAGSTTALSNSVSGGTWSSSATSVATVSGTGVVTGVAGGTAVITYTTGGICTATTTVTVNALPSAITGTLSVCAGFTTNLTDATTGGNWNSSATTVTTVGSTGIVTGVAAGTATISYILSTGCAVAANITVTSPASAGSITGASTVVAGGTTALTDATSGGVWSSINTTVATVGSTGVVTGVAAGTTTISYTVTNSCGSVAATATITVISSSLTRGNLVVLRVGDGSAALSGNATVNNVVEYTTSGSPTGVVIALPSSGTTKLTTSGSATSEGQMTMSAERDRLVLSGYDASAGTSSIASTANTSGANAREAFTIDATGAYTKASAPDSIFSGNNIRSATASGTNYFGSGAGVSSGFPSGYNGIQLMTAGNSNVQLSSTVTNTRVINIFNGQLYFSTGASNGIDQVGTNIPTTTGQTSSSIITGSGGGRGTSPYGFSVSPDGNTLYVADDGAGIQKYTRSGSSFGFTYTVCDTVGRGLIVDYSGSNAILYFTSAPGSGINKIFKVTDVGSAHATGTALAVAPTNTAFRGIAFAPSCNADITALSSSICSGASTSVVLNGNPKATISYNINGGSTQTTVIGANGSDTLSLGSLTSNTTVSLISISTAACASVSLPGSVSIAVGPAAITGVSGICAGTTINLSDTSGSGTGAWVSTDTTIASVDASGAVTGIASGTATISYTYSGCTVTQAVTVNAAPSAISGITGICLTATTALTDTSSGGTWSSSNTSIATVGSAGTVTGIIPGTTTISYLFPDGCAATATVAVDTFPTAITGVKTVCAGSATILSDVANYGVWTSGRTVTATVDASTGVVSGVAAGTATISYTTACGRVTTTVTVTATPGSITGANNVCNGATVTLSDAGTGAWSSSNTAVATIVSTTRVVTGKSVGTATITFKFASGCFAAQTVTVNTLPTAIIGTLNACPGTSTALTDTTAGAAWSSGNTAIATVDASGSVTGVAAGTAIITYGFATGCKAIKTVTVHALPGVISGKDSVCKGATITLSDGGTGAWNSDNTAVATIVSATRVVTGVSAGTANITFKLSSGCIATRIVTVNTLPTAIIGTLSACPGTSTTLTDTTAGAAWSSGNTTIATVDAGGTVTGVVAGTSIITYGFATGCQATKTVTVHALPAAISGKDSVCAGTTITLSDVGTGAWSSSDITVATIGSASRVVTGINAGTANITFKLTSGCITTRVVTVNTMPSAIIGTLNVCVGTTLALTDTTSGAAWSSGNTATATIDGSGTVTGVVAGTSIITYGFATGCKATKTVTVHALPGTITGKDSVCIGATITLSDAGTGSWSSSDVTTAIVGSATRIVTGVATGTATITFTLSSGCMSTKLVSVNPLPTGITGIASVCPGLTTTLSDATGGGTWSSAAVTTATVGSATGIVTGVSAHVVNITYKLTSTGCTAVMPVTVNPLPTAILGTGTVCSELTISLSDTTGTGMWSSGNTAVATINATTGTLTGIATGTSTITYMLGTGCVAKKTVTVNVSPSPITGLDTVCVGSMITLSDAGGGKWTSSTTSVATIGSASRVVAGISSGTTIITYTLTNGCKATETITVSTCGSSSLPSVTDTTLTVNGISSNLATLQVYPNPNEGSFSLLLSTANDEPAVVVITNVIGQKVLELPFISNKSTMVTMKSVQASGIYLVTVITAEGRYEAKIIVNP